MASTRAKGIEAELVFPVRSITDAIREWSIPSLAAAASMIRRLAWWGTNSEMSSMVNLAFSSEALADSTVASTARRKTSLPRMTIPEPWWARSSGTRLPSTPRSHPSRQPSPGTASTTTAPAPSPNRNALVRSSQLVARVRVSAPMRRTLVAPIEMKAEAVTRP